MNRLVEIKTCDQCPYAIYHEGYTNAFCLKLKRDLHKQKYLYNIEKNCPLQKVKKVENKKKYSLGFDCENIVKTWGGNRKGSGSKSKYNELTKTISFRVPISKIDEIKQLINHKLSEWRVK